ncbi:hypothetical protein LPJ56_003060 [Coemansia sp. RSA 2599]|nr:hypothetical protein LPJ75_002812 [Coemansia sp. RSA 2598]KAJ1822708.1 hypothetical protein LPJ56_003060 [Coemansia sp. RSA 2599]
MYKTSFALLAFVACAVAAGDSPMVVAMPNQPAAAAAPPPPAAAAGGAAPMAPMAGAPLPPAAVPGSGAAPAAAAPKPAGKPLDGPNGMTDAKGKDGDNKKPAGGSMPGSPAKSVKGGVPSSPTGVASKNPVVKQDAKSDSASLASSASQTAVGSFAAVVMAIAAISAFH